jgi:hypothetical protein
MVRLAPPSSNHGARPRSSLCRTTNQGAAMNLGQIVIAALLVLILLAELHVLG